MRWPLLAALLAVIAAGLPGLSGSRPALALTANACSQDESLTQTTQVNTAFPQGVAVTTVNQNGTNFTVVPNVPVTFTAIPAANGASGTFDNGTATKTVTSSGTGLADPGTFKANGIASTTSTDFYQVTATLVGSTNQCSTYFMNNSGTSVVGQVATLSVQSPQFQHTLVGTTFPSAFSVVALDSSARTLAGATITATAPTSGASGTFAGGLIVVTAVTGSTGIATFPAFTANLIAGFYSVQFTAGIAIPQAESLTNDGFPTTTTLTSSPSGTAMFGQPITLTASVTHSQGTTVPPGAVQFDLDGSPIAACSAATLVNAAATCTLGTLAVGAHSFQAVYAGGGSYNGSTSATLPLTVIQAATATTLTSSPSTTVFGQAVTFTATVTAATSGAVAPTGNVSFSEGAVLLGSGTVANGTATFTTSALSAGTHTITATYSGDTNFLTSTVNFAQTVGQASTAVALSTSGSPSLFGQTVTFTATVTPVAPGAGTPTGSVSFSDGTTPLGTGTVANGVATFTTSTLTAGSHPITAVYNGDASFAGSTSSALTQQITSPPAVVSVSSSLSPSVFGQNVTLTATLSPGAGGLPTPTGSVTFAEGSTVLAANVPLVNGVATFTTSALAAGQHTITVTYGGDASNGAASGSVVQTVAQAGTALALASSANGPSPFGQSVTFTATVTLVAPGAGTPTGSVTFTSSDGTPLNGGAPVALAANGRASVSTTALQIGTATITATYGGDTNFTGSSGSLAQVVTRPPAVVTVATGGSPSVFGQDVIFTATLAPGVAGLPTPSGNVTFLDGSTVLAANVALQNGVATTSTSALAVGSHTITVSYAGDASNGAASGGVAQTVAQAATTLALSSSANGSPPFGQSVTFTATVSVVAPGAGTPTGTVTFMDGSTVLAANVPLQNGAAATTTSTLTVGVHAITATYSGDAGFAGSSGSLNQAVGVITTTVLLQVRPSPAFAGQEVTLGVTVGDTGGATALSYRGSMTPSSTTSLAGATPAGSVTFSDNGTPIATVPLTNGAAVTTTTSLAIGSHSLTAAYSGDSTHAPATSAAVALTIVQPPVALGGPVPPAGAPPGGGGTGTSGSGTTTGSGGTAPAGTGGNSGGNQAGPPTVTVTYAAGWNLVSGPDGQIFSGSDNPLYAFQPGDTAYEVLPAGSPTHAGVGYWVYFPAQTTVTLNASTATSLTITLPAGQWVLIGNPSQQTLQLHGADEAQTWDTASGTYLSVTSIGAGQGVWVYSQNGGELTLSP
ncbi:MAG TPA: Ig-like domain-containing protein [Dehalococcoidia bacterium]|nr:Ig-like domain-containing protein [Dehalococcoidia bacterium]